MNQPHPNPAQANYQAANHPALEAMAPPAAAGYPPGHAHGAYNQGAAPHAPYQYALVYQYHPQGAYPVVMPPPPQPAPNRKRGFFMACFEAVFCCCLKNTNLGDVNIGGDGCICGDCFGAGDICFM